MKKIAIAAGKGGVGKSTVTVNLALAFRKQGAKVGIIDADLYGPSIGSMLGIIHPLQEKEGKIVPAVGIQEVPYISLSLFPFGQTPSLVRAPIANHVISEFLENTIWEDLDYLFFDFPPGTGDIQLTILQKTQLDGVVLVSSPQKVALLDVQKTFSMFNKMQVPVLGLVSNMSFFLDERGKEHLIFGPDQTEGFCKENQIPCLGKLPIDPFITKACDEGRSLFQNWPESFGAKSFLELEKKLEIELLKTTKEGFQRFDLSWKN